MEPVTKPQTNTSPLRLAINQLKDGKHEEAVGVLRLLAAVDKGNARLLHFTGTAELLCGNFTQSVDLLQQSLSADPGQADTCSNLGLACWHLQDYQAAEKAFRTAISLKSDYAEAYNNLSLVLLDGLNQPREALDAANMAILLAPSFAEALINRGNALQALGRFDEAVESYDNAIALNPNASAAHNNRGNALHKLRRFHDAIAAYQRGVSSNANDADAFCNMGIAYNDIGEAMQAHQAFDQALLLNPNHANAHFSLAALADKTGDHDLCLAYLDKAIASKPDFAEAHWNKALFKLLHGDFNEGFKLYEWGWKCGFRGGDRGFKQPRWLGQMPLAGKRLLIHHEQGIGDVIHYVRYVQLAVDAGAEVTLETLAPLIPLFKTLVPACKFLIMGSPLPEFDYYTPLMSLPLAFGTTLNNMPPAAPYLFADSARVDVWSKKLSAQTKPRVGLAWSGSTLHKNDHNRSISLKLLAPLLSLPFEFHSLQKEFRGDDAADLTKLPMVHTHAKAIGDFADTAALASLMDVIISVDTSVAHLTGAIGKPVWVLLPANPDWRWLLDREDSPWYPSARLFRQAKPGDWAGVITQVTDALIDLLPQLQSSAMKDTLEQKPPPPDLAAANQQLQEGVRLLAAGQPAEAKSVLSPLLDHFPKQFALHNRLAEAAFALQDFEAAAKHFEVALTCDPNRVETIANLGVVYRRLSRYYEALACQQKALNINPDYAEAYGNLGLLLHEAFNQPQAAIEAYEKAISLKPSLHDSFYNLGNIYMRQKAYARAIPYFEKSVSLKPDYGLAIANMAISYGGIKNYPEAVKHYQRAVELGVQINFLQGHYIYTKLHVGDWQGFDGLVADLTREVMAGKPVSAPFAILALVDDLQVQQRAIETFAKIEHPVRQDLPAPSPHPRHDRIRIGYFSSDFWNHPVAHLILGLFNAHDRNRFEVIAFSLGNPIKDKWHQRVKESVDQFIEVQDLSDKEVAELARSMEIDIAVDLNGFTEHCRAGIFAYRAAPVQVSYIGYLGTMGAPYIDYLVTDTTIVPPEARPFYNEKMIYLPSYQINDPEQRPSERPMSRAEFGLPDDAFVFCAFNNNYKITPSVFECWMRILNRAPNAVLWLFVSNEQAQENLRQFAAEHGVAPERLIFAKKIVLEDHLARQRLGDLFLDTLPYNAGATASNALRVGLPVLTRTGKSFAGRMGSSLLKAVGLPELITATEQEYEDKAVQLASDPVLVQSIRQKLAQNLPNSALFDNKAFARNIETAFQTVHNRACQGLPPMHVLVKD